MPIDKNSYIGRSKKISELRARSEITSYQDHTWIPIAQYNSRINAYHNIAMNLKTITDYCISYSNDYTSYEIDKINDKMEDFDQLNNITTATDEENLSYLIESSPIANTLVSYSFSYSTNYMDWQFL